jgi:uncharacterized protein (TIGR00369 family)
MLKKIIGKQPNSTECFVCGVNNNKGLNASFYETDEKEVIAVFTPHELHQSYPGRLHGGIAACILDETIGRAVQIDNPDIWGVTVELTLSYRKPLPYSAELRAVGRITKENRLLFEGEGEIYTPDGEVAVSAKSRYVKMTIDKISGEFSPDSWKVRLDIDDPAQINI